MSSNNGSRPSTEGQSPFASPFGWTKLAGDESWVSRDGIVRVRLVTEPEREVRLVLDGGTFTKRASAKRLGEFLMALLTGPDENARMFRNVDMDLLVALLDNWDKIDRKALRALVEEADLGPGQAIDVTDELEETA